LKRWPNARKAPGVNRTRAAAALIATSIGTAGLFGLAACPGNASTSLYSPITGLIFDSQTLLAGIGCGTAPNQVYKYAAVVNAAPDAGSVSGLPVSGVFDCFANGQLDNLPTPDGNTTDYVITIYAYNFASFPTAELGGCDDLESDANCQGESPATVLAFSSLANWTTTCTATQVQGVSEDAVCGSLVPTSDAGAGPDDGVEPDEGGAEAGDATPGDSGSAAETGPADSGVPESGANGEAGTSEGGGDSGETG
jgi:hypothetical protein